MGKKSSSFISKRTARSILRALVSPADLKQFQYLRVVIMCGLPGSGKSTIAQLVKTVYGFKPYSSDQIRVKELFKGQEHRLGREHDRVMMSRYVVYEELAKRVAKALRLGEKVVVDGTNMDDKRLGVLGGILSCVPVEQVAFVVLKPPEWIMRRRFLIEGKKGAKEWWSIYKYWRRYMKVGKASFPTDKNFPRIRKIQVRRYAIRTFDWVPDMKAIIWDLDGTLYKDIPRLHQLIDRMFIRRYSRATGADNRVGAKRFYQAYEKMGSKTKVLDSVGLDGKKEVSAFTAELDYSNYLKKDKKLIKMFRSLAYLKHYLLTNASLAATKRKLGALGLNENIFELIMATHDAPYMKPDPRIFKWALEEISLKPAQIVSVGDREKADILAAKTVGLKTCYVWGVNRQADVSLPTVYEVAELFGEET